MGRLSVCNRAVKEDRDIADVALVAGLGAGATEAVAVVTPMEVVKIRLQAQQRGPTARLSCLLAKPSRRLARGPAGYT